jgi:hypothetical protein
MEIIEKEIIEKEIKRNFFLVYLLRPAQQQVSNSNFVFFPAGYRSQSDER